MQITETPLLLTFWQQIQPVDQWLLTAINQWGSNPILDTFLPLFRETFFWAPLYLFLMLFVTMNFGKQGAWWILAAVLCAASADIISSQVIKQLIFRLRPCQDPNVAQHLRFIINYCPKSSSFTSSHATSYFAQATFYFLSLRHLSKWTGYFFLWAASIAYTQVYVGVHYPFDVCCGAILGVAIGLFIHKLFVKRVGMLSLEQ